MPYIFCHNCMQQFVVPAVGECPSCGEGFIEEVQPPPGAGAPGAAPPAGAHSFSRTFTIPGGTVRIVSSTGGGLPMMGPGGMPLGGAGAGADPFVNGVLEAVMRGGFLHPMPGGGLGPFGPLGGGGGGMGPFAVPGGGVAGGEQEWLDRLMSQIMSEYQPASQAASQRAVRSLPRLAVRAKDAAGEPGEGQAVARAGEPCSVCHDEFKEGDEVLELPCAHNYHADCLLPWLETHNTCPVCRHELPAEDPQMEARRRQRAEEAAGGGGGGSRHVRRRAEGQGGGSRLTDLLQGISARWESFRAGEHGGEEEGGAPGAQQPNPAAAQSGSRAAAESGGGGVSRQQQQQQQQQQHAQQQEQQQRPGGGLSGSSSTGGLRQRREAAAAAAERRLRGEEPPATTVPPPRPTAHPAAPLPPHPAAQAPRPAQQPSMRPQPQPQPQVEEEQGEGGVLAGAVLGGLAGALAGGLLGGLMLLGGRGRRERQ